MKQHTFLLSLGVVTAFLVLCNAERYRRTLDRPGINKTKEEATLLKQDVLDHATSTLDPKSVTHRASKTEATNHVTEFITEATYKPSVTTRQSEQTGEQLQKIPEDIPSDSHVEVSYERKITLREDNPQTDSPNLKNETTKNYNDFMKYKYNQTSPSSSVNSEVTISHSSYEQSSSVVYVESDDEEDYYTPEYEQSTKSTHLKGERKKKKKESVEAVTVPTSKPFKELLHKVDKIKTDALDERHSTTSKNSSLNIYNKLETVNNSLDFSVTTVSSKDNTISQSGDNVINNRVNIDSSTKKPRMTYSVKKSAVINDMSTIPTVSLDTARNTVPVVKWEKVRTTFKPNSDGEKITTEPSQIVKPSVDFKSKLGLSAIVKAKNSTVESSKEDTTYQENSTISKSTVKPIISFKDRKRPSKLTQDSSTLDFTIAPTSTAWVSLATLKKVDNKLSQKPSETTESSLKVKDFVPWSTRLQRSSTTQLSSLNTSSDDVTESPKLTTLLDSETSSSWSNIKVASSEITSTETSDDIVLTTTELEHNSTEAGVEQNFTVTEGIISDSSLLSVSELPNSDADTTEVSSTPVSIITSTNGSENGSSPLDMNQTSNELKVNGTLFQPKLPNKVEFKKNGNETFLDIPREDIFSGGLDDKIPLDDSDEEMRKETTHFDLPIETTTIVLGPDFEEESRESDNESERDDEELVLEKHKHGQTEPAVLENPFDFKDVAKKLNNSSVTEATEVVTGKPHKGDWYNVSVDVRVATQNVSKVSVAQTTTEAVTTVTPTTTTTTTTSTTTTTTTTTTTAKPPHCSWEDDPPSIDSVGGYVKLSLQTSWPELCIKKEELRSAIVNMYKRELETCQVLFLNVGPKQCSAAAPMGGVVVVFLYFVDANGNYDESLVEEFDRKQLHSPFKILDMKTAAENRLAPVPDDDSIVVLAVSIVCLLALVVLVTGLVFLVIRKRRKKFNYGQRCTPVSLDDYSLDNISVYNSVRRKGAFRASKRSYGNPAFDDPNAPSHSVNFAGLANLCNNRLALDEEFSQVPVITLKPDELPVGAETKNRYANVIPLPETRVQLSVKEGADPLDEYINANYVKGPKGADKFFIACQAPLQSTVTDFWRMIWQEQCKVILMLTALEENGVDKCADYLPPSQVIDCHCLFGDFQVTLKKHEVREKYLVSSLQIKNLETNSWREVIHLWYATWPTTGVPDECGSMIAYLLEAHSYMRNSVGPTVVHCSPGTGRTGTVIAIDLCIREFETCRTVDIPKSVYALRRDRAGAVQTKDQYAFIYKVLNLYATKLTGGALDSM